MELSKRAKWAIEYYNMLEKSGCVLVGLSGGADSVALLYFLKFELRANVYAFHLNHLLRKSESENDAEFVGHLCEKWDIPLYYKEADTAGFSKENKLGIEESGRILRYRYMGETVRRIEAVLQTKKTEKPQIKIATAHTLNDRVETFLLNCARGTSMTGLVSLKPIRNDGVIRPLISCTRKIVEEYCKTNKLKYIEDSSNLDRKYRRNRIRHGVLPQMETINPAFLENMQKLLLSLEYDEKYLDHSVTLAYTECVCNKSLDISALSEKSESVRRRVLIKWVKEIKVSPCARLVSEVLNLKNGQRISVSGNGYILRTGDWVQYTAFSPDEAGSGTGCDLETPYFEYTLTAGVNDTPYGRFTMITAPATNLPEIKKVYKNFLIYIFDYDTIKGNVCARQRREGDRITLNRRNVTKTLKKYFNENKTKNRNRIPIIADDEKVLAIAANIENITNDINTKAAPVSAENVLVIIFEPSE
ncbi:MAG: tRNA lysidine(34) synthetase TilS [Oscillospiraceae bacterium]|nr:tRNA lysidine(34) synthetase TilS [Oscillospiraceae bacterium]